MYITEKKRGFTLIELMVSISIFTVVMVISMGAIVSIVSANQKSKTLRTVMDNLNFTLESMTRTIRFGSNYHCGGSGDISTPNDCPSGDTSITVSDSDGNQVTYALAGSRISRSVNNGAPYFLTAPDVVIDSMYFWVFGSAPFATDQLQPRSIISIKGHVEGKDLTRSDFTLETMVSQRVLDFQ